MDFSAVYAELIGRARVRLYRGFQTVREIFACGNYCYEPYKRRQNKPTNARKVLPYLLTVSITSTELCCNRLRNLISSLTRLRY
jgi:hypothetical protein